MRRAALLLLAAVALVCAGAATARAQRDDGVMTDAEIEKLREAAYVPVERVRVFMKLIDNRTQRIQDLLAKPRHPGREQELHDLLDQIGAIAGEFNDNLDDYATHHRDVRKALPKLLEATERWATAVRAPADDAAYKIVRRIALDNIDDLHKAAEEMNTEQAAYFQAHPNAAKEDAQRSEGSDQRNAPVRIPH